MKSLSFKILKRGEKLKLDKAEAEGGSGGFRSSL